MKTFKSILACSLLAAGFAFTSHAALQVAGTMLVGLDATGLPVGYVSNMVNSGTAGGVFEATGLLSTNNETNTLSQPQIIVTPGGTHALLFDGDNFLQHRNVSPGGSNQYPPVSLTGTNPVCSIEVWALKPTISDEECMVSWGARTANTNQLAFNYGAGGGANNGTNSLVVGNGAVAYGSQFVGQSVNTSLTWGPAAPTVGIWHHLVYTFDGTTTKVYCDGVLANSFVPAPFVIPTNLPITIADERTSTSPTNNPDTTGSGGTHALMLLGRVRIDSGVLTAAQVASNYVLESSTFTLTPSALSTGPVHDWLFTNAAAPDAVGAVIADIGSLASSPATIVGIAGNLRGSFTGSALHLEGGASSNGAYVQLPAGMISPNSGANGGSGAVTVEGWVTSTGVEAGTGYPDFFSFGTCTAGHITADGGTYTGLNYFEMTQLAADRDYIRCEVNNTSGFHGGPSRTTQHDFRGELRNTPNLMTHYAVSWNENTGEVIIYLNGLESTRFITATKLNGINDLNCWLGRDQWSADRMLQGDYKEFRIYNRALSAGEVLGDYEAGPGQLQTNVGTATALHINTLNSNTWAGSSSQLTITADYPGLPGVDVTRNTNVSLTSGNLGVATVVRGQVAYLSNGVANLVATMGSLSVTDAVAVTTPTATLTHEFNFNEGDFDPNIMDNITGLLVPNALSNNAYIQSNALQLDGSAGTFCTLPSGMVTGDEAVTIELWGSFSSATTDTYIYALGDADTNTGMGRRYLFGSSHSSTRIAVTDDDPGSAHEATTVFNGIAQDGTSNEQYVAVYYPAAGYEKLYLNGQLFEENTNVIMPLKTAVADNYSYLGKSLYTSDPYFSGSIDEFRVWNGVLTPAQIALNLAGGPNLIVTNPGALQSVQLISSNTMQVLVTQQAFFSGNFANISNVDLFLYGGATASSDNTNVLTISPAGSVKAIAPGTAHIIARYNSFSATNAITVENIPAVLVHRYGFTNDFTDSIGGSAYTASTSGDAVIENGQVVLDGTAQTYVQFPVGILSNYLAVTFEAWATFGSNVANARLYVFGDQSASAGRYYVDMSPDYAGTGTRATIAPGDPGPASEQAVLATGTLNGQTNVHVVVVEQPYAGLESLYLNGRLAAINTNITATMADVRDNYGYLGQSLFTADPTLLANINEFRIWNGALSPQQIAVDTAAGPDSQTPGGTNVGALQSVSFNVATNLTVGQATYASLLGNFANQANVSLFTFATPTPVLSSANSNVVAISGSQLTAMGPGSTTVSVTYNSVLYSAVITVTFPPGPATPAQLVHRYSFSETSGTVVHDSVGGTAWNGTLPHGGTFNGLGQLSCVGAGTNFQTNQYILLPSGILSNYTAVTIDAWVSFGTLPTACFFFGFGNTDLTAGQGYNYIFCQPLNARIDITSTNYTGEQGTTSGAANFSGRSNLHVTSVFDPPDGLLAIYTNGVLLSENTAITDPMSDVNPTLAYIGRSLYPGDSGFNFTIDEFRIYSGAMTAADIAGADLAGPNVVGAKLSITPGTNGHFLVTYPTWVSETNYGYGLLASPTLVPTSWSPVTNAPVDIGGGLYQVTVPSNGSVRYYSLGK